MPVIKQDLPEHLKPYSIHGLRFNRSGDEALAECPWCGAEEKFSVNVVTGQWRCFSCNEGPDNGKVAHGGNATVFVRMLWERSYALTQTKDYVELASERGLQYFETLVGFGQFARSVINGNWIVPGYNSEGKMTGLYQYVNSGNRKLLLPTPGMGIHLLGRNMFNPKCEIIHLCEGIWDGSALWEMLSSVKEIDGVLTSTANRESSLLSESNVLATTSATGFYESWVDVFSGKIVNLMCQNDHDKVRCASCKKTYSVHSKNCPHCGSRERVNGFLVPSASYAGMNRIAKLLIDSQEPPQHVNILRWSDGGEKLYSEEYKSGYDVRDHLKSGGIRIARLKEIFDRLEPLAEQPAERKRDHRRSSEDMLCAPCDNYNILVSAWRRAIKWTEGLDCALSVMLSAVTSTKSIGEQLWFKILGPASSGKTTILEGIAVNTKYALSKSTIRGFHTGWKGDGDEDCSLIALVRDKTLCTKDGDTLLKSPNLDQILSEARDIYDRVSRSHYRNKMGRDYSGVRMTWLLCGTSALREIDGSELGARFLDCVVMDEIDDDFEDEVGWRAANQEARNVRMESDGEARSQYGIELADAMELTGGYVNYLRENAIELLNSVQIPEEALKRCSRLGKFVAYMRARPSQNKKRVSDDADREFSPRLVKQHVRLAFCLAVVLNKQTVDSEVMRRVTKVAMDTSRGITLKIVGHLFRAGHQGLQRRSIDLYTGESTDRINTMIRFLRKIGVVELEKDRWCLTERIRKLYLEVEHD